MIRPESALRTVAKFFPHRSATIAVTSASSTDSHQAPAIGRHSLARRVTAQVAVVGCCAAALVVANAASAGAAIATPAYAQTTNVADTMNRTVAVGMGTAGLGGTYVTTPASLFSVAGAATHIRGQSSGQPAARASLAGQFGDQRLKLSFNLPTMPASGSGVTTLLEFRRQANGDDYRISILVAMHGVMTAKFTQVRAGVSHAIGTAFRLPGRAAAGRAIAIEGLVAGTSTVLLRARSWIGGTPAPGWQLAATDSSSLRTATPGSIGFSVASGTTAGGARVSVTNLTGWHLTAPASAPAPAPVVTPPSGQPGASNTGVPAGTHLTARTGNMVITTAGATYNALDIHGFVTIKAANVTIKNSIIRGGVATSGNPGLVDTTSTSATNFVLEDSELVPEHPSVYLDGFRGGNFTLLRVDVHGTEDGGKIIGGNVTIKNSWIHGTVVYAHDPYQGNGPSHDDAIQVITGQNIHITGNTIAGGNNSGMQITQGQGKVGNLSFTGNWAGGGACTLNVADEPLKTMSGINISNNVFAHTSTYKNCAIVVSVGVALTHTGNTWAGTTSAVALTARSGS